MTAAPTPPRRTLLGHVPTKWLRPRRFDVVVRLLLVALFGTILVLLSGELATLDARVVYPAASVPEILAAMGEAGRAEYRLVALLDCGFLVVYGWLLVTWVRFLKLRHGLPKRLPAALALVPSLFDAIETASVLRLLSRFPEDDPTFAWAASLATPLKWFAFAVVVITLVVGEITKWHHRHDAR